jgi:hypothetical protein
MSGSKKTAVKLSWIKRVLKKDVPAQPDTGVPEKPVNTEAMAEALNLGSLLQDELYRMLPSEVRSGLRKPIEDAILREDLDTAREGMKTFKADTVDRGLQHVAGLNTAFGKRFEVLQVSRPSGAEQVKLRQAYLKEQKKLDGLVGARNALEALKACPSVENALAAFETAGKASAQDKADIVAKAISDVDKLDAEALKKMGPAEKAELAFNLCAAGQPQSGDALKQLCKIYNNTGIDQPFLDQRKEERKKVVEKVSKLPEVAALFDDKGEIDEDKWKELIKDENEVKLLLKTISDAQGEMLGLPPLEISTYRKEADKDGGVEMGGCVWTESGPPTISLNAHPDAVDSAKEAIITILHETFHAHQDILVKKLMAGELDPSDPIYPQVLMFAANKPGNGYLPPAVDQDEYEAQPVEVDAETEGNLAATDIFLAVKKSKQSV